MFTSHHRIPTLGRQLGLPLLFLVLTGCSSGTGKVTGKVTLNGVPLTSGIVRFEGASRIETAPIRSDGTYEMFQAPVGEVKICLENAQTPPSAEDEGTADPMAVAQKRRKTYTKVATTGLIPPKYARAETSGLTFTVTRGAQEHDIPLVP